VSRQRKVSRRRSQPSRARGGTVLGVFVGMIIGAVIVVLAVLFFNRGDNPFNPSGTATQTGTTDQPVATLSGKPGGPAVEKPDLTYFNTLPPGENAPATVPAGTPAPTPPVTAPIPLPTPPEAPKGPVKTVYLQLASFDRAEQADDLKAQLLLMGLEPVTQRAQLPDGKVKHRIRVGPFSDPEDVKAMRDRLSRNGFNAIEVSAN